MSSILVVGDDELLLETRAAVLRTIGAETFCCRGTAALAVQADRQCDLVILCHSLSAQLCAALAETIHGRWPKTRLLLVTPSGAWEQTVENTPLDAVSSADPKRLVLRTVELLGHRKPQNEGSGPQIHYPSARSTA